MNVRKLIAMLCIACPYSILSQQAAVSWEAVKNAVANGNISVVQAWLNQGNDPNAIDDTCFEPLIVSALKNHVMLKLFLEADANPNLSFRDALNDDDEKSLLEHAVECDWSECARMFVDYGANPESLSNRTNGLFDELIRRWHDRGRETQKLLQEFGISQDVGRVILRDVAGLPMQEQ